MPLRTTANKFQRKIFDDLSLIDELAITTKHKDLCSINIIGSFELFDKHWSGAEYPQDETMIALKGSDQTRVSMEPPVHFHIDWNEVRYAFIRHRRMDLINVNYEIVFCSQKDLSSRILWFYIKKEMIFRWLINRWGSDWINLTERSFINASQFKSDNAEPVESYNDVVLHNEY